MVEFTLFEVHLDDASFTANAPLSGSDDDGDAADGDTDGEAAGSGPSGPGKLLALFATLALAGFVMWAIRNGSGDEADDSEA